MENKKREERRLGERESVKRERWALIRLLLGRAPPCPIPIPLLRPTRKPTLASAPSNAEKRQQERNNMRREKANLQNKYLTRVCLIYSQKKRQD